MQFFSGQPTQHNDLRRYVASGYTLKEYVAEPGRLPAVNKLAVQRSGAPETLRFSVALTGAVLTGDAESGPALDYGLKVVRSVVPDWIVLRSRPDFRPGSRSEGLLRAAVERIKGASESLIAWEPRGLWDSNQIVQLTDELGIERVIDPRSVLLPSAADRPVYVRWRMLGAASGVSEFAVEDLAEQLADVPGVYAIAEGDQGRRLLKALRTALKEFASDIPDDVDEEGPASEELEP